MENEMTFNPEFHYPSSDIAVKTRQYTPGKPMVTVVCITYNHEEYIREALDSFLMQKTNFPYKIFVGEDNGPDDTAKIVKEYAEKYPDKIVPFLRQENMGAQRNLIDMCMKAESPYIAFCEGDDYWTDEYKLQKQFDFMEEHPEHRACVHATEIIAEDTWYLKDEYNPDEDGRIILPYSKPAFNKDLTVLTAEQYIKSTPAHTSSYFYRWNYALEIPEWYYNHFAGDHSLMMLQTGMGTIGIIPDVMSIYRRSEVGVYYYSDRTTHYFNVGYSWTKLLMDLREYFDLHYNGYCHNVITERIENGAVLYFRTMNELEKYEDFTQHLKEDPTTMAKMLDIVVDRAAQYRTLKAETYRAKRSILGRNRGLKEQRKINRLKDYKKFSKAKKDPMLWLFHSKKGFLGDARYLYEYIIVHHPEINAVWLANNKKEKELFIAENLPAVKIATKVSRELLKKASIFVCDTMDRNAFKLRGFNAGTKVVRLSNINFFDVAGNDPVSVFEKTERREESSEFYTDAFMVTAPSKAAAEYLSAKYELPIEKFFVCAAPRSEVTPDYMPEGKKILYVADYASKWHCELQEAELLEHLPEIDRIAEESNFDLYYYCKAYSDINKKLRKAIAESEHIHWLTVGDINSVLPRFDVMISSYSNIMFDFMAFDKPIIIYSTEKEHFMTTKNYTFDLESLLPGEQHNSITEALSTAIDALSDSSIGADIRKNVAKRIYDFELLKTDKSEDIVEEIISRLKRSK